MKPTILLACTRQSKLPIFLEHLTSDAYSVIETTPSNALQLDHLQLHEPAVLVLYEAAVPRGQIERIRALQDSQPLPIVLFIEHCTASAINDYILAGVTSLIVNSFDPHRLDSIIQIAKTRFDKCQQLKTKLSETEQRLDDRRFIEKAKGIIMRGKQINEEDAYQLMRSMAMEKNMKMGDLAKSVIATAELLG